MPVVSVGEAWVRLNDTAGVNMAVSIRPDSRVERTVLLVTKAMEPAGEEPASSDDVVVLSSPGLPGIPLQSVQAGEYVWARSLAGTVKVYVSFRVLPE